MRERRNYLLIMGAIGALLVGALFLAVPGSPAYKKPTLGLDLQGGLEVVLRAIPETKTQPITPAGMQTAQQIMTNRVNKLGVSSPNVAVQGGNQIVIQLAGVHDPAKAAKIIGTTGQLQMFDFEPNLAPPTVTGRSQQPAPLPSLYSLLTAVQKEANKGTPQGYYLFQTVKKKVTTKVKGKKVTKTQTSHKLLQGDPPFGAPDLKQLLLPYKNGKQPADTQILKVPANREPVWCTGRRQLSRRRRERHLEGRQVLVPVQVHADVHDEDGTVVNPNGPPELTGKDLVESGISHRRRPEHAARRSCSSSFTGHGGEGVPGDHEGGVQPRPRQRGPGRPAEHDVTRTIDQPVRAATTRSSSTGGSSRRRTSTTPTDTSASASPGNGAEITEPGRPRRRTDSRSSSRAARCRTRSSSSRRPRSRRRSARARSTRRSSPRSAGLLIVAIFLLVLYRFLGLVAVFGLAIYALLYYAAILLFNVTLTLPGFAGLILTIGVAADANVVVFERIKEEVRAGRSVRAAISAGYGKGFHTILDANVVTMITALVIFLVAVADVKGFALMLLIGTVISLLTAVAATRAMLGLLSGFKWFDNPRFMGAEGQQTAKWLQIDFMGKRRLWFAISGAIIIAGLISLGAQGLNLGIDFKGGTQFTFKTHQPYSQSQVKSFMAKQGQPDAVVQGQGHAPSTATSSRGRSARSRSRRARQNNLNADPQERPRRVRGRGEERLGDVRPPDRDRRDLRDHRLAAPDHDLHRAQVRPQVRDTGDPRDAPRHRSSRRRLLAGRARRSRSTPWPRS